MKTKSDLTIFICCVFIGSLLYSPVLLSLSMMALTFLGLFDVYNEQGQFQFSINRKLKKSFSNRRKQLPFIILTIFFLIVLSSFWQTNGDLEYFIGRLRIKLPFLVLPFAFMGLPTFKRVHLLQILFFLICLMTINGIAIVTNYAFNFQEIQDNIGLGHPMPTPRNHIRFSILTAISVIGGMYLIWEKFNWDQRIYKRAIIAMTIFLFVFIHFLSVRSGIACLYFALFVLGAKQILFTKDKRMAMAFLLGMIAVPFIAYHAVPSLNRKISYMMYDLRKYMDGEGGTYSDSGRLISLKTGYDLFMRSPIVGIGAGNLRKEVREIYSREYPDYETRMPHNQYLFVLAGTGLIGFIFFMIAFLLPLFYKRAYRNHFLLGVYLIFFSTFMLEHTIENAVGVATFLFFILIVLSEESFET